MARRSTHCNIGTYSLVTLLLCCSLSSARADSNDLRGLAQKFCNKIAELSNPCSTCYQLCRCVHFNAADNPYCWDTDKDSAPSPKIGVVSFKWLTDTHANTKYTGAFKKPCDARNSKVAKMCDFGSQPLTSTAVTLAIQDSFQWTEFQIPFEIGLPIPELGTKKFSFLYDQKGVTGASICQIPSRHQAAGTCNIYTANVVGADMNGYKFKIDFPISGGVHFKFDIAIDIWLTMGLPGGDGTSRKYWYVPIADIIWFVKKYNLVEVMAFDSVGGTKAKPAGNAIYSNTGTLSAPFVAAITTCEVALC